MDRPSRGYRFIVCFSEFGVMGAVFELIALF